MRLASMLISAPRSALLMIDIQERLVPAVHQGERVIANSVVLMKAATALDVPILVSEQYPKGLGRTVTPIADLAAADSTVAKTHFSCTRDEGFVRKARRLDRQQIVVAGIEAHVCVLQTVSGLLEMGFAVFVVEDATASRTRRNHGVAVERMRAAGAEIVTTEMVVFEWLMKAGTAEFREISRLVK